MATNISVAKNGSSVMRKILLKLQHNNPQHIKRRVWTVESADPESISTVDWTASKVLVGDFVYRIDDDEVFICTIANASATSATFIQASP